MTYIEGKLITQVAMVRLNWEENSDRTKRGKEVLTHTHGKNFGALVEWDIARVKQRHVQTAEATAWSRVLCITKAILQEKKTRAREITNDRVGYARKILRDS